MECEEAEELLAGIFDVEGSKAPTRELTAHVYACTGCRELLANLLMVRAMGRVARGLWGNSRGRGELSAPPLLPSDLRPGRLVH